MTVQARRTKVQQCQPRDKEVPYDVHTRVKNVNEFFSSFHCIRRYWLKNSTWEDFTHIVMQFYNKKTRSIKDAINPSTLFLPKTPSVAKTAVTLD